MRSTRQLSRAYMRPISQAARLRATFLLLTVPAIASSQSTDPQPLAMRLQCAQGDCPLLKGAPQTTGMRNGFVGNEKLEYVYVVAPAKQQ